MWWREGVLYQIYPRSFADSNGDGVGDLPGIVGKLDYLAWLGVDGIWLGPIMPSPNADWGYDVADYVDVDPVLGTLADLDALIAEAGARGIRVVLDLVPNHTSDRHAWFAEARASRTAAKRDWYVWADPGEDGSPPNNWLSVFGGPAWTLDEPSGQYYLHNFLAEQPDLNWWNDDVRNAFEAILRFWFDRGIAGFRIDVAHGLVKDRGLRDNPPATEDDPEGIRRVGQRLVYSMNRPEVHELYRRWRPLADAYEPGRVLLGEVYVLELDRLAAFYGTGSDELHLAFNFPFIHADLEAGALRRIVEETEALLPREAWPVWTGSNHDVGRLATRWCAGDGRRARCAVLALLTLRGTPVLYYGDEIGLPDTQLDYEDLRDPVGVRFWPDNPGRDACRTPMHWRDGEGAGFTDATVRPWLPLGDTRLANVAAQREDPASMLTFCRDAIALRRELPALRGGDYRSLDAPAGVWLWQRGADVTVALNLSDEPAAVAGIAGTIRLGTDRPRAGEAVAGTLALGTWEGAVVMAAGSSSSSGQAANTAAS